MYLPGIVLMAVILILSSGLLPTMREVYFFAKGEIFVSDKIHFLQCQDNLWRCIRGFFLIFLWRRLRFLNIFVWICCLF